MGSGGCEKSGVLSNTKFFVSSAERVMADEQRKLPALLLADTW